MDVDLLTRMVGELVPYHDRVGLPGLGTFVAEEVPASFSDRGYTINPPYRKLTFISGRPQDDLLIKFYAARNAVDYEAAKAILTQYLAEMKEVLKDRKVIMMPGLGRLRATRENNFFFVADPDLDIYPDGYGLAPISLKSHTTSWEEIDIPPVPVHIPAPTEDPATASEPAEAPAPAAPAEDPATASEPAENPAPAEDPAPAEAPAPAAPAEDPATASEPAEAPSPAEEPVSEEIPAPEEAPAQAEPETSAPHATRWWIPIVVLVALAAIGLAVFMILAQVAPDFIDSILYTPEELRIINY